MSKLQGKILMILVVGFTALTTGCGDEGAGGLPPGMPGAAAPAAPTSGATAGAPLGTQPPATTATGTPGSTTPGQPVTGNQMAALTPGNVGNGQVIAEGEASVYGPGEAGGSVTATEEAVSAQGFTAAMKVEHLPGNLRELQPIVKVVNKANGRWVTVRVNDRGPFVAGRVIDLTQAGRNAIGGGDLTQVRVERMPPGTPTGQTGTDNPAVASVPQPATTG